MGELAAASENNSASVMPRAVPCVNGPAVFNILLRLMHAP